MQFKKTNSKEGTRGSANTILVGAVYLLGMVGHNSLMELRHLRYFVAAAEALNISQAAKHLHVSQPPLSRQIRDLEQEIGTALFDRGHKKLKLTSAGQYFLQEAKKILSHAKRAARAAKVAGTGQAGQISIAFLSPLGGMFLPRILRVFRQKFPRVLSASLCR